MRQSWAGIDGHHSLVLTHVGIEQLAGFDAARSENFVIGRADHAFSSNTMLNATEFFRIPTNRVIELGGQIEI